MKRDSGIELNKDTKLADILDWLEDASRQDILGLAIWIRNKTGVRVPTSGSKDQLIYSLSKVPLKYLKRGIEVIFPDDEEELDNEDGSEEDSNEEDLDDTEGDDCEENDSDDDEDSQSRTPTRYRRG